MAAYPRFADDISKMRVLVCNDDGIAADGIKVLEKVAKTLSSDVWVVAPETEQSGVSHSLTLHEPLRIRKISAKRYAVKGTPTDCALLAAKAITAQKKKRFGLLLSGVNRGANMGEDVTYSGTVAAAIEGTLLGIPSIAISMDCSQGQPPHWNAVEKLAPDIIRKILRLEWPNDVLMNVNFPDLPASKIKGVKVAPLGRREINEKLTRRSDPFGRDYYWIGAPIKEEYDREGVDIMWLNEGYITITPLSIDLTHFKMLEELRKVVES